MKLSRREVLRVGLGGLGVVSAGATPSFISRFAFGGESKRGTSLSNDNVLVVVQLSGGNDGLNTVVPVGDDAYVKARPSIALKDRLHELGGGLALHGDMTALKQLFDDGRLAIINGCGYPHPDRSHFNALDIWHTASPARGETTGWLGRYLDHVLRGRDGSLHAVCIGPELPQALVADRAAAAPIPSADDASRALEYLARQSACSFIDSGAIARSAARHKPDTVYPGGLGRDLKLIAQLICANAGARVYCCQLAGFDTHANQLGQHARLLNNLSNAIAAFTRDLDAHGYGDKVTVMCFSEFGRRVSQNGSGGTDHGAAGPMFVVGRKVKGGVYGRPPSLVDLDDGDLKYTTDFRRVYATLLDRWLKADSTAILHYACEPIEFL